MRLAMPHLTRPRPTFGVIRLVWAALLLAAPARVISIVGGPVDHTSVTVARILGARHAAQGLLEVATWPKWSCAGSLVDAAHGLTAAALGVSSARRRRVCLIDSAVATAFAFGGLTGRQPGDQWAPVRPHKVPGATVDVDPFA
jgi:hypothetical protein